ncbi:hypothetical protein DPMN_061929 [Dreissena polymorpha]|uniref:Uncharacterized protein n=1 Tax=Dreissena polymorpha TaxID=45954 RepID=A0A9D4C8V9_DREPO|nr:hypothetical protein DPMN_061929 [Dreissena polymorpha]
MDTVLPVSTDSAISSAKTRQISRVSSSEICLRLLWLRLDEVFIVKTSSSSLDTYPNQQRRMRRRTCPPGADGMVLEFPLGILDFPL